MCAWTFSPIEIRDSVPGFLFGWSSRRVQLDHLIEHGAVAELRCKEARPLARRRPDHVAVFKHAQHGIGQAARRSIIDEDTGGSVQEGLADSPDSGSDARNP